jgi:hypothetical protein
LGDTSSEEDRWSFQGSAEEESGSVRTQLRNLDAATFLKGGLAQGTTPEYQRSATHSVRA